MELIIKNSTGKLIVNGFFLIILNLSLMTVIGYLTLDSHANLNSRVGGILLSFLMPYFIVTLTKNMNGLERMLKFGLGFVAYILLCFVTVGLPTAISTGLIPCLVICLCVLNYGNSILKMAE